MVKPIFANGKKIYKFTITKSYHEDDGYSFSSAKEEFINDISRVNFKIIYDVEEETNP